MQGQDVELEDFDNGRPIILRTSNEVATKIQQLKPKRMYKQILALSETMPNTKEKYMIKANAEMHLRMWKELSVTCDRGLDLSENSDFYNLKGKAVGKLGNFQEKVELTKKAIELEQNVAAYHRNLGAAYYKLKQYSTAILAHDRAIEMEPKSSINFHNKGAAYFRLGQFEQAKGCFEKAIDLDRKQVISHSWLGDTQREMGNFERAKQCYAAAYEISGQDSYKDQMRKMDDKIAPERKKGLLYRIFG